VRNEARVIERERERERGRQGRDQRPYLIVEVGGGSRREGPTIEGSTVGAERLRVQKLEKPTKSVRYLEVEKVKAKAKV
jgi:hypothetical protein